LRNKAIVFSHPFEKAFARLPIQIREAVYEKLELFAQNPGHPSLRVKKIKGTDSVWEMSITMNYRLTFEFKPEEIFLRRIGTHDILNHP